MSFGISKKVGEQVFSLQDWNRWLERLSLSIFGISGLEFREQYAAGRFAGRPIAEDLASAIPLIERLEMRRDVQG